MTVRDYREAAELSEKLADKFVEIRALTLFRWKVTGAVLVVAVLGLAIVDLVWGRRWVLARDRGGARWRSRCSAGGGTARQGGRPCWPGRAR